VGELPFLDRSAASDLKETLETVCIPFEFFFLSDAFSFVDSGFRLGNPLQLPRGAARILFSAACLPLFEGLNQ
jgi:hypothetical protein